MSIVEKAAARLGAQRHAAQGTAPPPSVVRAAERNPRARAAAQPHAHAAPVDVLPWHVDRALLRRVGLEPTTADGRRRLAGELRRIKRPLLDNIDAGAASRWQHPQRIAVCSAIPDEGKTFTAINLALSLAHEPDFDVVLIDGDVPKANITHCLGLQTRVGLMDVLAGSGPIPDDIVIQTDIPRLSVVPAGRRQALAAELLRAKRMDAVLAAFTARRPQRLLVFDTPPLLATAEAPVIAAHMGQIVMVVAAGRTNLRDVQLAQETFGAHQYVGMVLNMSRLPASENRYYNYYHAYAEPAAEGEGSHATV